MPAVANPDAPVPVGTAEDWARVPHTVLLDGRHVLVPAGRYDAYGLGKLIDILSDAYRRAVAAGEAGKTSGDDDYLSVASRPELLRELFGQPTAEAAGPDEWVCEDCGMGWTYPTPPDDDSECDTCGGSLCPN
jgi:hypothetical protein